jgi:hypothetical protein
MGMLRQSLPQLQAKAYAQECCSEWNIYWERNRRFRPRN